MQKVVDVSAELVEQVKTRRGAVTTAVALLLFTLYLWEGGWGMEVWDGVEMGLGEVNISEKIWQLLRNKSSLFM